ncbi:MAG: peroxiredoxin [Methyloceanibacter sp.]
MSEGEANRLKPGAKLPLFALASTDGSDVCLATLSGRSVIAVYPWTGRPGLANPPHWDDIPGAHGSTPELEGFRDCIEDFAKRGVTIFGLSRQTTDYQREMVTRLRLPFLVLSDADGAFAAALRLPSFATGGEGYLRRLTLVVAKGMIESVIYPVPDPAGHAADVLRRLG